MKAVGMYRRSNDVREKCAVPGKEACSLFVTLHPCFPAALQAAFEETDSITGHWLTHAADLLAACSQHLPQLLLDDAERRRRRQQAAAKQGQGGQQAGSAADVGGGGGSSRVEPQPAAAGGAAGPGSSPLIAAHADGSLLPGSSAAVTASAAAAGPSDSPVAGAPTLGGGSPPAAAAAAAGAIAGAGLGRSSSSGGAGSGSRGGSGSEGLLPEVVHVAVTSGQLVPTLAKLLLFHLGAHFTPDRVRGQVYGCLCACLLVERLGLGARTLYAS